MKTINIAGILILGFALTSGEKKNIDIPEVCMPVIEPGKEVVVDSQEPTADIFSRPRKPCPPSGPGRK
tara:strand:- start:415 stop:618 length:204 start_codon:yes stop_codon:yes gene_type:complete